jgi:hypothetical protein
MTAKKPKSRLPSLINLQAIEARKRDEAKEGVVQAARSYVAVYSTCGMAFDREYVPPIGPEEEDRRLARLIDAVAYYDEVFYPQRV